MVPESDDLETVLTKAPIPAVIEVEFGLVPVRPAVDFYQKPPIFLIEENGEINNGGRMAGMNYDLTFVDKPPTFQMIFE